MRKNIYQVIRTHIPPYQSINFSVKERRVLESLPGINYRMGEDDELEYPIILLSNSHTDFNRLKFDFDKIKLVIHSNSGHENISPDLVKADKFPIISGNPIRAHAVASYISSCIFEYFCKIPNHVYWNRSRFWNRDAISKKNMLLIGYGHIGTLIEKIFTPLVKSISIYDPYKNHHKLTPEKGDIVVVAASLNSSSYHLLDESFLNSLPEDFLLINIARGQLIDQKTLLNILRKNIKAYAYLDVFEKEPFSDDEFKGIVNIKTTSHIAGVYNILDDDIIDFNRKVLLGFLTLGPRFKKEYHHLLLKNRLQNGILI
ncbi:MAG: hypothetical protein OXB84_08125 [Halobacteriovoraceae bacterium]|nr:hypothetical protein [Halobacteriovoraceae bacterium]